jgi:hypothetical protein
MSDKAPVFTPEQVTAINSLVVAVNTNFRKTSDAINLRFYVFVVVSLMNFFISLAALFK